MTERGILLKPELYDATMEGRKTQTRRVIAPQPKGILNIRNFSAEAGERYYDNIRNVLVCLEESRGRNKAAAGELTPRDIACPYGLPGDRLYVKEKLHCEHTTADDDTPNGCMVIYSRDSQVVLIDGSPMCWEWGCDVLSPRFMPKRAARLWLEIIGVRVERVQAIGSDGRKAHDVLAEGITREQIDRWGKFLHPDDAPATAFCELWDRINAKRGFSWESNPWVWCIEYQVAT